MLQKLLPIILLLASSVFAAAQTATQPNKTEEAEKLRKASV